MSYTPPDQYLRRPLEEAADALEALCTPIRNRMRDAREWKPEHLEELGELLQEIVVLEAKLRLMARSVR